MRIRHLLIAGFALHAIVLALFGGRFFGAEMTTATDAMVAASLLLSLMFLINRCFVLNLLIALFVTTTFFLLPWSGVFMQPLEGTERQALDSLVLYFTPDAAARVYVFMALCLAGWCLGLLLAPPSLRRATPDVPRVFSRLDGLVRRHALSFWVVLIGLQVLTTWQTLKIGYGALSEGSDGGGSLLFYGLLDPAFIVNACLFAFAYAVMVRSARPYLLLLPLLPTIGLGLFMGSRGVLYSPIRYLLLYVIALQGSAMKVRVRPVMLILLAVPFVVFTGILANQMKPLWIAGAAPGDIEQYLISQVTSGALFEQGRYLVAVLIARVADLSSVFMVVGDRFVNNPWPYVSPVQVFMRTVNDLVPGDAFPGMLTINQLFPWIYQDNLVVYSSAYWTILGFPYLYFGFFGTPLVFLFAAMVLSRFVYERVAAHLRRSPSYALFWIVLVLEIIENGTVERVVVVDVVRVVLTSLIFVQAVKLVSRLLGGGAGVRQFAAQPGKPG